MPHEGDMRIIRDELGADGLAKEAAPRRLAKEARRRFTPAVADRLRNARRGGNNIMRGWWDQSVTHVFLAVPRCLCPNNASSRLILVRGAASLWRAAVPAFFFCSSSSSYSSSPRRRLSVAVLDGGTASARECQATQLTFTCVQQQHNVRHGPWP